MKYKLQYDRGEVTLEANNDAEAQTKARDYLKTHLLLPQKRKNYLYRWKKIVTGYLDSVHWRWVNRTHWQWVDIPF